jgi:chorismate mutase
MLERGEVDAIVTDTIELPHFMRASWKADCEPPRDRKVYWVSPAQAKQLGPKIDAWLDQHEHEVAAMRTKWIGQRAEWTELQHLIDLIARRLALMPAVAEYKRAHALPIDDPEREAVVLRQAIDAAAAAGLDPSSVRALFAEQIELAKAIQRRTRPDAAEPLDLDRVLRPALTDLGERITAALASSADALPSLRPEQLDLTVPLLEPAERQRLLDALRAVRPAQH